MRRSPGGREDSWLKRRCAADEPSRSGETWQPERATTREERCALTARACPLVVANVQAVLGSRRRSEVEVLEAMEGACGRLGGARSQGGDTRNGWCEALVGEHGEAMEEALREEKGGSDPVRLCAGAVLEPMGCGSDGIID